MEKKNEMLLHLVLLVIWIFVLLLLVNYSFTYMHEAAHVQISEYYGYDAEMHITPMTILTGSSSFYAEEPMNRTITENERIAFLSLHSINEIVGYNVKSLLLMLWFFGLLFISKGVLKAAFE